jgi:metal-responsive CopG/Arc/MetJ family transcriptional regulator
MANAAKIACSIDAELLQRVEAVRARTGESRSAFISRALLALTAESVRARSVKRYVEAYRDHPEGPADLVAARKSARRALSRVAWEDA